MSIGIGSTSKNLRIPFYTTSRLKYTSKNTPLTRSDSWFKDEKLRKKISKVNAPGFAAMNWPDAAKEQLLTMAKFIAWVCFQSSNITRVRVLTTVVLSVG
jgi:hypothetical protein